MFSFGLQAVTAKSSSRIQKRLGCFFIRKLIAAKVGKKMVWGRVRVAGCGLRVAGCGVGSRKTGDGSDGGWWSKERSGEWVSG